jgi:xylulokinase
MFIGIDIGTSSVKTVLIDETQRVLGSASASLSISRPAPGWSEQDPHHWWQATQETLDALASSHPREIAAVTGIGLSGQMHGATLLDARDQPLRPAILWNDVRSAEQCRELEAATPAFREQGGNIVMPGFTAPKLAWVRRHEPGIFEKTVKVLLPKDYVRLCLIGDHVGDMSDAAGTMWLDVARRDWSDTLLRATGLARSHMPRLVEGSASSGELRGALRRRWNIRQSVAVAGGGGDNAASACGIGAVRPGNGFVSLGTSGVLFVANAAFSPNTAGAVHAFCHALPCTWHQMGVILSASDSLQWLGKLLGRSAPALTSALGDELRRRSPVTFLPYLSGERTPHNDAAARGVFVGLGHESDAKAMTQAVLEGVAYAFRDCLRVLNEAGTDIETAYAVGGGAQSRLWLRILASVLDRPLLLPGDGSVGGAFGAARLGMAAATGQDPLTICAPAAIAGEMAPEPALVAQYAEGYAVYRALYPSIRNALGQRNREGEV